MSDGQDPTYITLEDLPLSFDVPDGNLYVRQWTDLHEPVHGPFTAYSFPAEAIELYDADAVFVRKGSAFRPVSLKGPDQVIAGQVADAKQSILNRISLTINDGPPTIIEAEEIWAQVSGSVLVFQLTLVVEAGPEEGARHQTAHTYYGRFMVHWQSPEPPPCKL